MRTTSRHTSRPTTPAHNETMRAVRDAVAATRKRAPMAPWSDVWTATSRTLEMLAAPVIEVTLGESSTRKWLAASYSTVQELKRQARRVARHQGKDVRLLGADGQVLFTARSGADR